MTNDNHNKNQQCAIVNRAWMMGDTSVDRHGNPVEPPAPTQSDTVAYSIGSREWADMPPTEENKKLFQRWLKGEDVHPITDSVTQPAPAAESEAPTEAAPVKKKRRIKSTVHTIGNDYAAWAICGGTVVLAVAGALGADMGSSGIIEKLLFAAALLVGAIIITVIIMTVGAFICTFLLGIDGIDKPRKWRMILCIALFVVLLALMM